MIPHFQSSQTLGQLGTRLGGVVSGGRWTFLGNFQSLCFAHRLSTVSQSPRTHQRKKEIQDPQTQGRQTQPHHRTRPELARELIALAASWFPNDSHMITGDSAYGGKSILSHLPDNVHLISHVHCKGALYAPPPPPTPGRKGPPRKKGNRLPTMVAWANDATKPWTEMEFDQFGFHARLAVKSQQALYFLGLEDPANRVPQAVQRTAPMAMIASG